MNEMHESEEAKAEAIRHLLRNVKFTVFAIGNAQFRSLVSAESWNRLNKRLRDSVIDHINTISYEEIEHVAVPSMHSHVVVNLHSLPEEGGVI